MHALPMSATPSPGIDRRTPDDALIWLLWLPTTLARAECRCRSDRLGRQGTPSSPDDENAQPDRRRLGARGLSHVVLENSPAAFRQRKFVESPAWKWFRSRPSSMFARTRRLSDSRHRQSRCPPDRTRRFGGSVAPRRRRWLCFAAEFPRDRRPSRAYPAQSAYRSSICLSACLSSAGYSCRGDRLPRARRSRTWFRAVFPQQDFRWSFGSSVPRWNRGISVPGFGAR